MPEEVAQELPLALLGRERLEDVINKFYAVFQTSLARSPCLEFPDLLDRVELGGVAGQVLEHDAVAEVAQQPLGGSMVVETIPDDVQVAPATARRTLRTNEAISIGWKLSANRWKYIPTRACSGETVNAAIAETHRASRSPREPA